MNFVAYVLSLIIGGFAIGMVCGALHFPPVLAMLGGAAWGIGLSILRHQTEEGQQ